jgi:hypothetical protein
VCNEKLPQKCVALHSFRILLVFLIIIISIFLLPLLPLLLLPLGASGGRERKRKRMLSTDSLVFDAHTAARIVHGGDDDTMEKARYPPPAFVTLMLRCRSIHVPSPIHRSNGSLARPPLASTMKSLPVQRR